MSDTRHDENRELSVNLSAEIDAAHDPALFTANVIKAVLFASGDPVPRGLFLHKLNIPAFAFEVGILRLKELLSREEEPLLLREIDDKYQLLTKPEYGEIVRQALSLKRQRMSNEALETLSIVAYRQPITKSEIEAVRGVGCDSTLTYLENNGLIRAVGRIGTPGAPIIYETTDKFLLLFGLSSLSDLPQINTQL